MSNRPVIHPGKQVGHLHVIAPWHDGSGIGRWECECACGRHVIKRNDVLLSAIRRGQTAGCGRGCTMRKGNRRGHGHGRRNVDTDERFDWGAWIANHHELVDRYRTTTRKGHA